MSVINKMLQDLEQRQPSLSTVSGRQKVPQPASGSKTRLLLLTLPVLLVLLGGLWFSQRPQLQAQPVIGADQPAVVTAEPAELAGGQSDQQNKAEAGPATIVAALSAASAGEHSATTHQEEFALAENAVVDVAAVIASEPAAQSMPELPNQPDTSQTQLTAPPQVLVTEQQPALTASAKPKVTVDKQPLSVAAQQHNMQLRANASEAAGDTSAAIVIWQQLVARQPAEAAGYLNLARLWLKQQQVVSASQVLLKARQNGVVSAEINMQLAQLAVRQGQWQQALEFLSDQFELAAEPEYFGFKATVLQQLQQYEAALGWYQRLQQLQPDQGRWSLGAALASEQLGQPLQAHRYYKHAWQYRQALSASSHNFIQQRLKATEP
ncbi:hypothetical protein [Arsukibacterium indicum]|uniref:MSHA biogenesis protein MshN n=1 Tax=Arsukibacterium indicum TaxID=2848612 RepID=A0ABS6MPG0_9GAMM|nr:hypothetical protein [Arsukibacterium indicum]MBV2130455.1 hypothetical protein [Arsukibacterium indicum]